MPAVALFLDWVFPGVFLVAQNAIAAGVLHVLAGWVSAPDRGNAVGPGRGAGYAAIIVVGGQCVGFGVRVAAAIDPPGASTTISVDLHPAYTSSMASPYSWRSFTILSTYQHEMSSGSPRWDPCRSSGAC